MKPIAVMIPNYNMPEATDALVETIEAWTTIPHFFVVLDNGSDKFLPSRHTTMRTKPNKQKTWAFNAVMKEARQRGARFGWLLSTSQSFDGLDCDPLEELLDTMHSDPHCICVNTLLTGEIRDLTHIATMDGKLPSNGLYDLEWMAGVGYFDERFVYSWGIDFLTAARARQDGRTIKVNHNVRLKLFEDAVYVLERGDMTLDEYHVRAREEMNRILTQDYGPEWRKVLAVDGYV